MAFSIRVTLVLLTVDTEKWEPFFATFKIIPLKLKIHHLRHHKKSRTDITINGTKHKK